MKKNDYRTEFEEHRKEISLSQGGESDRLLSRSEMHRRGRKPKKKSGHGMINMILGLFTLIIVIIFIYVIVDFPKSDITSAKVANSGVQYETSDNIIGEKTGSTGKNNGTIGNDDEKEDADKKTADETAVNTETQNSSSPDETTTTDSEQNSGDKTDENEETETATKPTTKTETNSEQKPASKTHKVAKDETLFSISMKYYKSAEGIEKIKSANGLTSNNIIAGQALIIP